MIMVIISYLISFQALEPLESGGFCQNGISNADNAVKKWGQRSDKF